MADQPRRPRTLNDARTEAEILDRSVPLLRYNAADRERTQRTGWERIRVRHRGAGKNARSA